MVQRGIEDEDEEEEIVACILSKHDIITPSCPDPTVQPNFFVPRVNPHEMLESDPDWVPSLHMGPSERNPRGTEHPLDQDQRRSTETRSLRTSTAGGKFDLCCCRPCNDFFRDALEASLEASSRSRAPSAPLDSTGPTRKEVPQTCEESSSSCGNCDRLLRRCMELQEAQCRVRGGREDMENLMATNEDHLSRRPGLGQQADPVGSQCKPRFMKAWLKMFWFLRYSPTLNLMWCHVCRLYADESRHKYGLLKGYR
ncbi:hypothetical protein EYF80_006262 [Liparis tanakae]|uniref:Uncharacterized protein n=1 Tax=Liparis tanakae TaxID=230148 RepID=A0A4Z2J013_9TELE|nr:hypothetical protein EYF80_006262 [Liparis tanakae]